MKLSHSSCWFAVLLTILVGCSSDEGQHPSRDSEASMQSKTPEKIFGPRNELGFAKVSYRDGDVYFEGVVDGKANEVVQPSSHMLVNDISGSVALVQFERKFLFVPLGEFVSEADLRAVNGFQYAEPFSCGLALVSVDDVRFYINSNFEKAFDLEFEFAESFHHDRALVMADKKFRIIDTHGKTVADLNYDQVNLQSPWCWQVTDIEQDKFMSGFVDLDGNLISELIYDQVGYYDPEVKRIRVSQNGRYGFLDENAKVVVAVKYEYAEVFDRGKAKVVLDGRAFFIDPNGIEVPE